MNRPRALVRLFYRGAPAPRRERGHVCRAQRIEPRAEKFVKMCAPGREPRRSGSLADFEKLQLFHRALAAPEEHLVEAAALLRSLEIERRGAQPDARTLAQIFARVGSRAPVGRFYEIGARFAPIAREQDFPVTFEAVGK